MDTAINSFLTKFALEHRPQSIKNNTLILKYFIQFLRSQEISHWRECDQKIVRQYMIYRSKKTPSNTRPLSYSTMQLHLSTIRVFFKYLISEKIIEHNPTDLIKYTVSKRALPKVIPVDLLHAILESPPQKKLDIRDLAICELFYSSGLRLNELTNINWNDIDLNTQEVRITNGKGGKSRIVPLGKCAKEALLLWKKARNDMLILDKKAVFISPSTGHRLTSRQISNRIKILGAKVAPGINIHPHMLRHSMASHVLESCHDIRVVQELLGHKDIATTQIYTEMDFSQLAKIYDKTHPRAKRKNQNLINED